jgi:hypothetical protein
VTDPDREAAYEREAELIAQLFAELARARTRADLAAFNDRYRRRRLRAFRARRPERHQAGAGGEREEQ